MGKQGAKMVFVFFAVCLALAFFYTVFCTDALGRSLKDPNVLEDLNGRYVLLNYARTPNEQAFWRFSSGDLDGAKILDKSIEHSRYIWFIELNSYVNEDNKIKGILASTYIRIADKFYMSELTDITLEPLIRATEPPKEPVKPEANKKEANKSETTTGQRLPGN